MTIFCGKISHMKNYRFILSPKISKKKYTFYTCKLHFTINCLSFNSETKKIELLNMFSDRRKYKKKSCLCLKFCFPSVKVPLMMACPPCITVCDRGLYLTGLTNKWRPFQAISTTRRPGGSSLVLY